MEQNLVKGSIKLYADGDTIEVITTDFEELCVEITKEDGRTCTAFVPRKLFIALMKGFE